MSDTIHNPTHYTQYPIQPIEITRHLGFCLGNAVKYVLRAPFKGESEDCDKALKYLEWEGEKPQRPLSVPEYLAVTAKIDEFSDLLHGMPGQPWMEVVTENQADFLDMLSGYLECGDSQYLEQMRVYVVNVAEATSADRCRVCGCIDERACEGGCFWVEGDLCSACAEKEHGHGE